MKASWTTTTLGEVAETQYGLSEPMNEEGRGFKIFRMGEVQGGRLIDTGRMKYADISRSEFERYKLGTGDVLFNRTNSFDLVGKTGIFALRGDYCFPSYLVRLNLDRGRVLPKFLNYFMNSERFQESVKGKASRSINQANINASVLSRELISFPESVAEQRRIVSILDEAFEGIANAKANAEKNLQNARALFESHLQSVFSQVGKGWVEKTLQEVADASCTLSYGIVQPGNECVNGLPVVRPTDLTTKVIRLNGLKRIDPRLAGGHRRTVLLGGELLLCVRGVTGVVSIASAELAGANVTRGIVPIRFNGLLIAGFGFYLMSSGSVQSQIRARTYGAALMQINIRDVRNIALSFPPLNEQEQIATRLDLLTEETQRLALIYQNKLAALEALKKSLLHQAFTGQL